MGTYHHAHLVYGYDLGSSEDHKIAEVDEYGSLAMPWVKRDDEDYPDESLTEALTRKLYEAIPDADPGETDSYDQSTPVKKHYGVQVLEHGWLHEGDTASFALIAHEVDCDGGDAEPVDLDELSALSPVLRVKLTRALEILEITPNQQEPSWLLLASR